MATKRNTTKKQAKSAIANKRKRRRRGKYTLYYFLALFVCMAAGVILSFTVFFRLESIKVVGNTIYPEQEIIATSQVRIGDNMFRLIDEDICKAIKNTYPFIAKTRLRRKLPTVLEIVVVMEQPEFTLPTKNKNVILVNAEGKVLDNAPASKYPDYIRIEGFEVEDRKPMDTLSDEELAGFKIIDEIQKSIKNLSLEKINVININDIISLNLLYDNRVIIKLGGVQEIDYKLEFADYTIKEAVDENFVGVIDVSNPPFSRVRAQNIYSDGTWCFSEQYKSDILPFIEAQQQPSIDELEGQIQE